MITGKTRSGKTQAALRQAANETRLIVFDYPGRDWPQERCERIVGIPALCERLAEVQGGPARISFQGKLDSKPFGRWASVSLAWAQFAPVTIVAEELADVVHPGKAPSGWGELVRGGLAYGVTIIGITQRIQETDKSIFGNATTLRIFRTGHREDSKYIAKHTGIAVDDIESLKALEYLEKDNDSGNVERKIITFS